ncbi:MAG: hypothetical protein AB7U98_09365 [Candidatus Nitrosocosmicus sp.]
MILKNIAESLDTNNAVIVKVVRKTSLRIKRIVHMIFFPVLVVVTFVSDDKKNENKQEFKGEEVKYH